MPNPFHRPPPPLTSAEAYVLGALLNAPATARVLATRLEALLQIKVPRGTLTRTLCGLHDRRYLVVGSREGQPPRQGPVAKVHTVTPEGREATRVWAIQEQARVTFIATAASAPFLSSSSETKRSTGSRTSP